MRYRKLRIAWSVGWGIACVLLIVLWVRSYWRGRQSFDTNQSVALAISSDNGVLSRLEVIHLDRILHHRRTAQYT